LSASDAVVSQGITETSGQTEIWLMLIPLILILFVIYLAYTRFVRNREILPTSTDRSFLANLFYRKFYVDELYESAVQKPVASLSSFFHDEVEIKLIDRFVNQTGNLVVWIGKNIRYMQTGNVGVYLFYMVVSIILILFLNLLK